MFSFFYIYLIPGTRKAFGLIFLQSSVLVQIVLYFSNGLSLSILKDINFLSLNLNVVTYPFTLGDIEISPQIISFKHPFKSLELFFVSINFEISILSTSTPLIFIDFITS